MVKWRELVFCFIGGFLFLTVLVFDFFVADFWNTDATMLEFILLFALRRLAGSVDLRRKREKEIRQ